MGLGDHLRRSDEKRKALSRRSSTRPVGPGPSTTPMPGKMPKLSRSLSEAVSMWLADTEPSRTGTEYIHASKLYNMCTRQHALAQKTGRSLDSIPSALRVRFDVGHAIEDVVRERYLGPMGKLLGVWECRRCGHSAEGVLPSIEAAVGPCRTDEPHSWKYNEYEVRDHDLKLVGHLDGVEPGDGRPDGDGLLEIKSKEGALFRGLRAPDPEHLFRGNVYCWLRGLKWGRIFYVSTALNSRPGSVPFREFEFKFDLRVVELVRRAVRDLGSGGVRACQDRECARALLCPVREACWR